MTHGDRRASETCDLSEFNIDSKYGLNSLNEVMRVIMQIEQSVIPVPEYNEGSGNFFNDVKEALQNVGLFADCSKKIKVPVFLNR